MRVALSEKDKAAMYQIIKELISVQKISFRKKVDLMKIAFRFTPGNSVIYLHPAERELILTWLSTLLDLARFRKADNRVKLFKRVLRAIRYPCTLKDSLTQTPKEKC